MAKKIFGNFDAKALRQVFGARTQHLLESGIKRLDTLPPFFEILNRLKRFRLAALAIAGIFCADMVIQGINAYVLKPSKKARVVRVHEVEEKPYVLNRSSYDEVIRVNPFCPGCPVPDIKVLIAKRPKDCNKAKPLRGSMKLIGTIVLSQSQYSVATVTEGSDTVAIKQGENFKSYGRVFEIRRNRVCFEATDGLLNFIELPDEPIKFGQPLPTALPSSPTEGITVKSANEVEIKRSYLVEKLQDPNILFQAHAVPFKDASGNIQGFKILSIVPGSVYTTLGLEADDVIQAVNGERMDSLGKAQALYAEAGSADEVTIEILRNNQTISKVFKIRK